MKKKLKKIPGLLWITGYSGSGKTTISKLIKKKLSKKYSNIVLLDGDILRKKLKINKVNSFNITKRKKIGLSYVSYCQNLVSKKKYVIIATIALFKKVQEAYQKIENVNDVFLKVPLKELKRRDPKNLYKKYYEGEINNISGLDLKSDIPENPSLIIDFKKNKTINKILNKILKIIDE